ncbi:protein angel isoform X1 [Euwallacea similis]|uniref:protein angel isoform X1 n=2 Tax=Euwallacea similis TaxID=1736056 RepID=UPI00344DC556
MVWIVPRISLSLLLPKQSLKYLSIPTLNPEKSLSNPGNTVHISNTICIEMDGPHDYAFLNDLNFRRARSEENIHFSSPHNFRFPSGFVCEERYFSSFTEAHSPFQETQFGSSSVQNGGYYTCIPQQSLYRNFEFGQNITPHNFLMHNRNVQNIQQRYFVKRSDNAAAVANNQGEITEILKVLSKRYWQEVNRQKKNSAKHSFEFLLMSYNVLAQDLLDEHPYLYRFHNPKALNWELRWKNLFNEIKTMRPDVLCLQEVQHSHLKSYFSKLETLGYEGLYKKRTGIRCDGCAIYYKTDRLTLVEYETVEFYQPNVSVLNRDNIAIIAKFCPRRSPSKQFVVATTHLLYNPRRQDVRLAQTQLLLTEVERLSFYFNTKGMPKYWPIIITGDFNSTPDSVVYELITKGFLKYDHLAKNKMHQAESPRHGSVLVPSRLEITDSCQHASLLQRREKNEDVSRTEELALIRLHHSDKNVVKVSSKTVIDLDLFSSGTLTHLFALKSAYQHGLREDPEGTTFHDEWITVDYIFYSGKKRGDKVDDHKLNLLSTYRLPLKSELGCMSTPNSLMGSDHLSLVAKFDLKV